MVNIYQVTISSNRKNHKTADLVLTTEAHILNTVESHCIYTYLTPLPITFQNLCFTVKIIEFSSTFGSAFGSAFESGLLHPCHFRRATPSNSVSSYSLVTTGGELRVRHILGL